MINYKDYLIANTEKLLIYSENHYKLKKKNYNNLNLYTYNVFYLRYNIIKTKYKYNLLLYKDLKISLF